MLGNHLNLSICILIGCEILALQANSRALSSIHRARELRTKRQTGSEKNCTLWESSWRSETVDGVTTITTATFGNMLVGESISQASSALWSYTYSYPEAPNITQNVDLNNSYGSLNGIEDPEKSQDQSYKPVSPNNFSGPSSQPNSNGPSGPSNEDDPSRAPSGNGPSSTPSGYGTSTTTSTAPSEDDPSRAPSGNSPSSTPSGYGTSTTTSTAPSGDDPSRAPSGNDPSSTPSGYGTSTTTSTAPSGDDPSRAPSGNDPSSTPSGYGTSTTTSTAPSGDDPSGALSANDASRTSSGHSSPTSPSGDEPSSAPSRSSRPAQHIKSAEDATKFTTQRATGDIREWLDGHNLYRSRYGAPDLKWDSSLANQAQGVANSCRWRHTANNPSGENIAAGQESATDTVIAWVEGPDEKESYDPASPQFSHFTQVVWESTTHVGCATVTCSDIQGASLPQSPVDFYVCEYAPKGNIYGQFRENVKSAKGGQPLGSNTVYPDRSKSLGTSYYFPAPEG